MATTTMTTTTTTTVVEAQSLAPVLKVAADPPFDPVVAIPGVSEPVVLYIAKVPGSKDVFLTPIKPRDRTITAEDISSSLYFLHVHGPEDEAILRKPAAPATAKPHQQRTHSISRKKLPSVPAQPAQPSSFNIPVSPPGTNYNQSRTSLNYNHPLPQLPAPRNAWPASLQPGPGLNRSQRPPALSIPRKPVRKPVLTSSSQFALQNQYNVQAGNRRKPGAPGRGTPFTAPYPEDDFLPVASTFMSPKRETFTIPELYELPASEMMDISPIENTRRKSADLLTKTTTTSPTQTTQASRRHSSAISSMLSPSAVSTGPPSSSIDSMPPPSAGLGIPETKEYQFTLIRRDPGTGQQCNVATIYSHAPATRFDEDSHTSETTPNWMNIVMETPGYHKFHQNVNFTSPAHSCADLLSPMMSAVGSCAHDAGGGGSGSGHRKFHRHLQMEFSKFGDLPPSHSKILSQDRLDFGAGESGVYGRSSGEFAASQMSLLSPGFQTTHKQRKTKRTGYAFRSPWDGRCEFSSASTGHSTLKCKHAFGPSLLSPTNSPSPNQISELRYNLPSMLPPAPVITKHKNNSRLQLPFSNNNNNDSKLSLSGSGGGGSGGGLAKLKNRFSRSTSSLGVFKFGSSSRLNLTNNTTTTNLTDTTITTTSGGIYGTSSSNKKSKHKHRQFAASTLDLSLGQERAGGGFSGNHSKLGKLIIENEGLKMMDLLVAANMSVWWKSYERR